MNDAKEFFEMANELVSKGEPFAVATVVKITGSSSAKPGAKAIINAQGETLFGWIGGGCAEAMVAAEAVASLKDGKTRIMNIDLTDEVLGAGMPCGGSMEVYVEPFLPKPHLLIIGHGKIAETLAKLGQMLNFRVTVDDPAAAEERFAGCQIITEDPDFSHMQQQITPDTYLVIATHHKSDHLAMKKAMDKGARYIALIASRKRASLVFDYLREQGVSEERLKEIRAPAGLDLGAVTPEEIALSIMSEIILLRRGGTGKSLTALKGPTLKAQTRLS